MALLTATDAGQAGAFAVTEGTLTADDTLTINAAKKQLLVLRNDTGGLLTATLDGDGGTTVQVAGLGLGAPIDVSAGKAIPVAANSRVAVMLNTLSAYTKGVVHLTGGTGLKAQIFNI